LITRDVFPLEPIVGTKYSKIGRDGIASPGLLSANRKRFPMSDEHDDNLNDQTDDNLNDPIDDELDDAVMLAAELVARAKRIGMAKLELPIKDESALWTVTVQRADRTEHQVPGADGHGVDGNGANRGQHDGKMS
jgi:hypothetical protein